MTAWSECFVRAFISKCLSSTAKRCIGRANLTGAGIGMKSEDKRNFEAGILTDAPAIVEQAMNQFDDVWIGKLCKRCKRRVFCIDPIIAI